MGDTPAFVNRDRRIDWCKTGDAHRQHDKTGHRLYRIHQSMIGRCYRSSVDAYPWYGGRGIYICDEWYTPGIKGNPGFVAFYEWSVSNGYADGLSIDRIDGNGPYAPWNCRWATKTEQCNNQSSNRHIYDGSHFLTHTQAEAKYGVSQGFISIRLKRGWTESEIVYALKHQELGLTKRFYSKCGIRDKNGYLVLIPRILGG